MTHAGFAAIIGAPNAGKSTLTNRLVGAKVSIVTQKVQTTRFPVRGVALAGEVQIVLVGTPGPVPGPPPPGPGHRTPPPSPTGAPPPPRSLPQGRAPRPPTAAPPRTWP